MDSAQPRTGPAPGAGRSFGTPRGERLNRATDLAPGGWLRLHDDQLLVSPESERFAGRTVGVLALQGAFAEHAVAMRRLGATVVEVRTPKHLEQVEALAMPGGESTTMSKLLATSGLFDPLAARLAEGMPTFGTCAGMILLAAQIADGRPDQRSFAALDVTVRRNGYGRQVDSFEADLDITGLDKPFTAVFIRAPVVERIGESVTVLAEARGNPVLVQGGAHGQIFASSFHPEITADLRIHQLFFAAAFPAAASLPR
jgi:pyridoxal 5'-phosphate synthase pdxT subunit